MAWEIIDDKAKSALYLTAASGVLYAASRIAIFALARQDGSDPGRRAIGQWLPIAGTAITAIFMNRPDMAVAVVFGTSVTCLSLVLGMATSVAPLEALPPSRKVWPFVLPAALLTLMMGFSAHLTMWHALMLLVFGGAVLLVWLESPESSEQLLNRQTPMAPIVIALVVAVGMTVVGGIWAVKGTLMTSVVSSRAFHVLTPGTLGAAILSPLLVLPTLGTNSAVAQRGYPGRALTAIVGTVLLNFCLLLPICVFLWYGKMGGGKFEWAMLKEIFSPWDSVHALPYDMIAWRVETVIVVVLGFALVPVAMGRWALGRLESGLLIAGYAAYIVAVAMFGLQLI